jgi:REP element-mobilizing transposase RayT
VLKAFYRGNLPHLQRDDKPHFVTFCTFHRWILPECVRRIVLDCCLHDHGVKYNLHVGVVMPDHGHLVLTPLVNQRASETHSLAEIMDAIKGTAAHKVNRELQRKGKVWQTESFDRVLRTSEKLDEKIRYILDNPVRSGLAAQGRQYPWVWAECREIGALVPMLGE